MEQSKNRLRNPQFGSSFNAQDGFKIVVEESNNFDDNDVATNSTNQSTPRDSLDIGSPINPYLLSPWRETRKHSLPSQQVTEGITASQVRRLSERGGEGSGPSPREAEFLATLSQAPQPSGRRHSVVTISKVPFSVFGRGRRESVAAFPTGGRVLASRRESQQSTGPPATDPIGSIHNLQLDIMDDIVQARKARMKLWNTSNEKVCEVQTYSDAGNSSATRYTNRRYSDFVGSTPLAPIPAASLRRASEMPVPILTPSTSAAAKSPSTSFFKRTGIAVTNTDFKSLITSLASSATEINKVDDTSPGKTKPSTSSSNTLAPDQGISRSNRSNSFDVSILHNAKQMVTGNSSDKSNAASLSGWFEKRHQPMSRKKSLRNTANVTVSFSKEVFDRFKEKELQKEKKSKSHFRWDNKSAFVDPHIIGNAIEGFLRKSARHGKDSRSKRSGGGSSSSSSSSKPSSSSSFWFGKSDEDDSKDSCDSSLCSTLKDLFVK
ncbi:uncharacterized serine-rich protein C215.13 [Contarinia nasturtii]|uniref:uncharacterized serine-rich protein C215.13 n=1 Tax=Contarinia nasturtii TaxID=265458 RepID=UPI0012D4881C|nr:uncharacterized serine-rich protein C215.13 [Contarinia nasturtii]